MSERHDELLTPEERRLAALLASDAPRRKPNPAMDAAILSAAREAIAPPTPTQVSKVSRWAPLAGLAATVALSGFLLLRYGQVNEIPNVPAKTVPHADSQSQTIIHEVANPASAEMPVNEVAKVPVTPRGSYSPKAAVARAKRASRPPPAARAQPVVVFDDPSPMVYSSPPPAPPAPPARPAPPAPPARPAAAVQVAPITAEISNSVATDKSAERVVSVREDQMSAKGVGRVRVATPPISTIPTSEDAKLAKDAWIARIEQRIAQGDPAGAKESLTALLRRHPDAELPKALEELR